MTLNFGAMYQNANPDAVGGDGGDPPEDGRYQVALIDAGAAISKKEKPYQKMVWQRLEDRYEWTVIHGFGSEGSANMAKREAREVGCNVDEITSLEELDAALKAQVGGYFIVDVRTNGDFRNTYVAGTLTGDVPIDTSDMQPVPAAAATGDDGIPF